jgi:hypothetical protein
LHCCSLFIVVVLASHRVQPICLERKTWPGKTSPRRKCLGTRRQSLRLSLW